MAASCPRCGAAIVPGMRSCQFCGTAVEFISPAAPSAPAGPDTPSSADPTVETPPAAATALLPPAPDASPAAVAAPRAPEKVPALAAPKKSLRSYAIPVAICLLSVAFMFFLVARVLNVSSSSNHPAPAAGGIPAPQPDASSSSSGAGAAAGLGIDLYPGAIPLSGPEHRDSIDSTVVIQSFVSSDKMDFVINFYKARMVGYTSIYASGDGVVVSTNPSPQDSVLVAISPAPTAGQTRITITHTRTRPTN